MEARKVLVAGSNPEAIIKQSRPLVTAKKGQQPREPYRSRRLQHRGFSRAESRSVLWILRWSEISEVAADGRA